MAHKRLREIAFPSHRSHPFSSSSRWAYDVFLSFAGDTRGRFTDHLHDAFVREGIPTFRDENELERGGNIGPELLKAIENSKVSVVVLSKEYALSTWCLDELVHILECKRILGIWVVPLFYDVAPSDVRKLKGSLEDAFRVHKERVKNGDEMNQVERWKDAVREVANLSGFDLQNPANGYETTCIRNIVMDISNKLKNTKLSAAPHPVGLRSRAYEVISLLHSGSSDDFCIIEIYGVGGVGKTTIAKEVFNLISHTFEGRSFLTNMRQTAMETNGLIQLQEQLLSDILMRAGQKIYNVDVGINVIKERLCRKKILVVLDDVSQIEQVDTILGDLNWLCPGSRIILTTRVEGLLVTSKVCHRCKARELNFEEALRLFSFATFGCYHPPGDYLEYSKSIVKYAGGIPLALKVIGSSLFGKCIPAWKCTLSKLKLIPNVKVQEKLRISYDSLDDDSLAELVRRGLLMIDSSDKLVMHDLICHMGREIVRQESCKNPGKRSRLWLQTDAQEVLANRTGTMSVEGLELRFSRSNEVLSAKSFRKMKRLRLLSLDRVCLSGDYKHIPKGLKWLRWSNFSREFIPSSFDLRNLGVLDMRFSRLKNLWDEPQFLEKLKYLNLSHSRKLRRTPNFKWLPGLEILKLKYCTSLLEIHKSVGVLAKLVCLNLKGCKNLKHLPKSICALISLERLVVSGCLYLDELPGSMNSLLVLSAEGSSVRRLPQSFENLRSLQSLSLSQCHLVQPAREKPLSTFGFPASLKTLDLGYCNLSDETISFEVQFFNSLEDIKLCGNNFTEQPDFIRLLPRLRGLSLKDCKSLQSISALPTSLWVLDARECSSLAKIDVRDADSLSTLYIQGCCKLEHIDGVQEYRAIGMDIVEHLLGYECSSAYSTTDCIHFYSFAHDQVSSPSVPNPGISSFYDSDIEKDIPDWVSYQNEGNSVSFNIHSLQSPRILGFIVFVVFTRPEGRRLLTSTPEIVITNVTKTIDWANHGEISASAFQKNVLLWKSSWMFDYGIEIDTRSERWRFKNEMQHGDLVKVSVEVDEIGITTKRIGVHIVCQENSK